jgi:hypothetical protein
VGGIKVGRVRDDALVVEEWCAGSPREPSY